jgi:hypothetical protein
VATSTPSPRRTLGDYVAALVERLGEGEPRLLARLREVVGARRARIGLDDEVVNVWFEGGRLVVADESDERRVDGEGRTDRETTFELLAGRLEVADAILQGRLQAQGDLESLARTFQAIEILLDASTRNPSLQRLAADYRLAPPPAGPGRDLRAATETESRSNEREMLRRLDLLP